MRKKCLTFSTGYDIIITERKINEKENKKMYEIRKYKEANIWGNWKQVNKEVAEKKAKIYVNGFPMYQVREIKEG